MYEEGNKKLSLNWSSLIIKLIILAVAVFIVCLIITKLISNKNETSNSLAMTNETYINQINAMKEAGFEYFTLSNLPEKIGGTKQLTLGEMIDQKLLIDFTDNGKTCNLDSSYIKATKTADGNYALKVNLDCNDKSDFIVTTIEEDKCVTNGNCNTNDDVIIDDNSDNSSSSNNNSSSSNNSSSNSSSSSSSSSSNSSNSSSGTTSTTTSTSSKTTVTVKTTVKISISWSASGGCGNCIIINNNNNNNNNNNTPDEPDVPDTPDEPDVPDTPDKPDTPDEPETIRYYKHERWTDWSDGYSSASNAENRKTTKTTYNYCKLTSKTYYTTSYVTDTTKTGYYSYELQLLDINPSDIISSSIKMTSHSYFSNTLTDYTNYLNTRDQYLEMTNNDKENNAEMTSPSAMKNSALKSNNFTYSLSSLYLSGGRYRTNVTIYYKNHTGVTPYYANNLGFYIYDVPIKFNVEYASKNDCIRDSAENSSKYSGYIKTDPQTETYWEHRLKEYTWSTNKSISGWTYTGIYEDREV